MSKKSKIQFINTALLSEIESLKQDNNLLRKSLAKKVVAIDELENASQKLIENSVTSEHYPKYLDELEKLLTKGGEE
jgi:hypothetical protein